MEKIDFVLTWVDGSDPDWLKNSQEYQPGRGTDAGGEQILRLGQSPVLVSWVWRNFAPWEIKYILLHGDMFQWLEYSF